MERFTFTTEGYKQAKEWLESTGKWEYISTHGFSTDGWSIIETANVMWTNEIHSEIASTQAKFI
jgi:hypothetical protein